ncbi:Uncharacterised protein [Mycobacteroides abscessus subsp. abscessus]|nr:Uncharacterised protein [Mycobacteroides abscessus subsp. abscessus]SIN01768.1 Uncharacterised protein [Mycobacteroides abscessus subsp. abscessus]SIN10606.1 Uncharacterised protein [Mycobacteroides abscessus subsp. abscessus]
MADHHFPSQVEKCRASYADRSLSYDKVGGMGVPVIVAANTKS